MALGFMTGAWWSLLGIPQWLCWNVGSGLMLQVAARALPALVLFLVGLILATSPTRKSLVPLVPPLMAR